MATDERALLARYRPKAKKTPCPNRFGKALDVQRAGIDAVKPLCKCTTGIIRGQDFAFFRGGGEARGKIHCVAGDRVLAMAGTARAAGDDLSTGHPDVDADGTTYLSRHVGYRGAYGQRCTSGPFGIVTVRNGSPEDTHDAVADVLVDAPTMLLDDPIGAVEELLE